MQKPWHTAKKPMFTVCQGLGTRQTFELCRVPRLQAHGKGLATSSFLGGDFFCRGSIVAHGKPFAVCPIYSTRQRLALPIPGCRVRFAVCGTRQRVCRGLLGLYRVPLAPGKGGVSRSEHRIVSAGKSRMACQYIIEVLLMSLTA